MAARDTIGAKIVLEGEAEYRQSLKNINAEQKELRSEMRLCNAEFKDNGNSVEALTQKQGILAKQISAQTQKVDIFAKAWQQSAQNQEDAADKINELKQQLSGAEAEMKQLSNAAGASTDAISKQQRTIDDLKNKLAVTETEYRSLHTATADWKTSLNNAKTELTGLNNQINQNEKELNAARGAMDQASTATNEYGNATRAAAAETSNLDGTFKNISVGSIIAGITALAVAAKQAGDAIISLAVDSAQYADDIATTATNTGIATQTLQELTYAAELMDVSAEQVTTAMAKNIKAMDNARKGGEAYQTAYKKLNVEFVDAYGNLRDNEVVFWEIVDALKNVKQETDRDAIAMQLFGKKAQDLNSLITIGSEGFREFAKEAHETGFVLSDDVLENLLKTSDAMERMKNRITGVKNNIGAELAPTFAKAFDDIGNAVEDLQDDIVDLAEDAIPAVVDAIEWLIKNGDTLISIISGITAANITWSASMKISAIIEAVKTAMISMATATTAAAGAQTLLNAAISANPLGILAVAVGAAVTGITSLGNAGKEAATEMDILTKETQEFIEETKALNQATAESAETRKTSRKETETTSAVTKKLVNELTTLQNSTKKTSVEQSRMRSIVDQLNQIMPELNLAIDGQTELLNMSTDALAENADAMMKMQKAAAVREELAEIAAQQSEAEIQLLKIEEKRTEQQILLAKANGELAKAYSENINSWNEQEKVAEIEENLATLTAQMEITTETTEKLGAEYESAFSYMEEITGKMTETTSNLGPSAETAAGEITTAMQDMATAYDEVKTAARESIDSQAGMFDELKVKSDMSVADMIKNIESQKLTWRQYDADLKVLLRQLNSETTPITQEFVDNIAAMGVEGAGYIHELVNTWRTDKDEFNEIMKEFAKNSEAKDSLSETLATMQTGFDEQKTIIETSGADMVAATEQFTTDITDVIIASAPAAGTAMAEVGDQMIKGISQKISYVNKQSNVFFEIGRAATISLADGISSGTNEVARAINKMVQTSLDSADISELANRIDRALGEAYS